MPVSRTSSCMLVSRVLSVTPTRPPRGVYLSALSRRLSTTWVRASSSPMTAAPSPRYSNSSSMSFVRACASCRRTQASVTARQSIRTRLGAWSADSIRARESRSLTSDPRRRTLESILSRKRRLLSGSSRAPSSRVSTKPRIEVRGVLSSWLTLATKSLRTRSSLRSSDTSSNTRTTPVLSTATNRCTFTSRERPPPAACSSLDAAVSLLLATSTRDSKPGTREAASRGAPR